MRRYFFETRRSIERDFLKNKNDFRDNDEEESKDQELMWPRSAGYIYRWWVVDEWGLVYN